MPRVVLAGDVVGVPGGILEFAINTNGRRAHPAYPAGFEVDIDTNGDGVVDASDLAILLGAWGSADPAADLNGDGSVDASDLAILLGNWG